MPDFDGTTSVSGRHSLSTTDMQFALSLKLFFLNFATSGELVVRHALFLLRLNHRGRREVRRGWGLRLSLLRLSLLLLGLLLGCLLFGLRLLLLFGLSLGRLLLGLRN